MAYLLSPFVRPPRARIGYFAKQPFRSTAVAPIRSLIHQRDTTVPLEEAS